MLGDGVSEDAIAEALREWDENPDYSPRWIAYLTGKAVRAQRIRKSEADKYDKMRDWEKQLQEELSG